MWDLIVSVPDHCLSFYFARNVIEFLCTGFLLSKPSTEFMRQYL